MLDPRKRAELEQGAAAFREAIPAVLWALYDGSKERGFTEQQAMAIVLAYVHTSMRSHPDHLPPGDGPCPD